MQVNTNIASLNSQRNLASSQMDMNTAIQRLSSGLRINSAKDDAAGLAISNRMSAQIRGLDQAARNANDGISVSQVAEGALGEITNMLQRMREVAVQSASDSNTASDRVSLAKEFNELKSEIDRIAGATQYNGKNLLDGTFTGQKFQIGAYANQTLAVSINDSRATAIGSNAVASNTHVGAALAAAATAGNNGVAAQTLTLSGPVGTATASVAANDSAKAIADSINGATGSTGIKATASTSATIGSFVSGGVGTVTFTLSGRSSAAISANVTTASDLTNLADAINAQTASTGIAATLSSDKASIALAQSEGYDIKLNNVTGGGADGTGVFSVEGVAIVNDNAADGGNDSITVGGKVDFSATSTFTVVTSTGTTVMGGASTSSTLSSISASKVDTQANSTSSITNIDGALAFVNDLRATLGAQQSRFSAAISNLKSQSENVSAARSRIADTDFAAETAKLTRAQVLQQAGTAMLAQANAIPQGVLSLLRG